MGFSLRLGCQCDHVNDKKKKKKPILTSKARSAVTQSGGRPLNAGPPMEAGVGATVETVGTAHSQQAAGASAREGVGGFAVHSALT